MKKPLCFALVLSSALLSAQNRMASAPLSTPTAQETASEKLTADTPKTTVLGNTFIAPKDWTIRVKGDATILEAPEGDSWVALVDVQAKTADEALAAAAIVSRISNSPGEHRLKRSSQPVFSTQKPPQV